MLLDEFTNAIDFLERKMQQVFGDDIRLILNNFIPSDIRYFKIEYYYVPKKYKIKISIDLRLFGIIIEKEEGAIANIYDTKQYYDAYPKDLVSNLSFTKYNIEKNILVLEKLLINGEFYMYIYKNDKVYIQENGKLRRIKDMNKHCNEVRGGKHE